MSREILTKQLYDEMEGTREQQGATWLVLYDFRERKPPTKWREKPTIKIHLPRAISSPRISGWMRPW